MQHSRQAAIAITSRAFAYLAKDAAERRAESEATLRALYLRTQDQVRVLEAALEAGARIAGARVGNLERLIITGPGSGTAGCLSQSRAAARPRNPRTRNCYALRDLPHTPMLGTLLVRVLTYLTPALSTIAQVFRRTLYRVS